MATARVSTPRRSSVAAEIAAWVDRELAKPEAQKPLTPHQVQVIRTVFANHEAVKAKAS